MGMPPTVMLTRFPASPGCPGWEQGNGVPPPVMFCQPQRLWGALDREQSYGVPSKLFSHP